MTFIIPWAIAVGIILTTGVVWRLVTKRDDAEGFNKVNTTAANILFYGTVAIFVLLVIVSSYKA